MRHNAYGEIDSVVKRAPDSLALELDCGKTITYRELDQRVSRFAARLYSLGAEAGDRVVAQIDKSVAGLLLYLACIRSGFIFVPLNTAYQSVELKHFVRDALPKLVICKPSTLDLFMGVVAETDASVLTLDACGMGTFTEFDPDKLRQFETIPVDPHDVAVIIYTSGTTGRSKGAMVTHRNIVSNARALIDTWQFSESDILLHALPVFHVHGLFVANHCALFSGARIILQKKFDPMQVLGALPRATVFMGVPTFYARLLEQTSFNRDSCKAVRLFISGSAPLSAETFHAFENRTGHRILERYGMSEAGMICSNPLHGERRAGAVGFPLPGVEIRVVDVNDRAVNKSEPGGIQIRGENVFAGYWKMADKSADEFSVDGFFRTGDIGVFDEQGYLSIVGRARDLIISGGYNVYPKEIEMILDALPGVRESVVIGLPDRDFGEAVTAIIVLQEAKAIDEAQVIALVRKQIANYKVPKRVFIVDDLPRNAMGKVQKARLRERFGQG